MWTQPSAKVILDSVSPDNRRLTTLEVVMHRFVLAEFNTHRVFSRNSASSRAIPLEKQIKRLHDGIAYPVKWAAEQRGMQGGDELEGEDLKAARHLWNLVFIDTIYNVEMYLERVPDKSKRLHKSLINRLLEPFMYHTVIVTSTDWGNFFAQRSTYFTDLAQPEMAAAADAMYDAYIHSVPTQTDWYEWHTPYIQPDEADLDLKTKLKVSAARCARVSYLTHDGKREVDKDIELFDRLTSADPMHASPLEHVAQPTRYNALGNFVGWTQLRHNMGVLDYAEDYSSQSKAQ